VIINGEVDMTLKFSIHDITEIDESHFDRQERISWWDQNKLKNAKVLVVGAGAIGNETLKNLALLGIGNIYIIDFDMISKSNLSRTVLFRKGDEGKLKAEVAALRTKEMVLQDGTKIHWFHGDAVWEIGTGIFREMDIVLGCLDNVETRFFVNRQCWLANTPWIDAGIYELGAHVTTFIPPEPPCYQCGASKEQLLASRKRYSCDDFKRTLVEEGKMPTVQVTSSLVSAIQVQEAVKFISGQQVESGKKIYFQGKVNDFDILTIPKNDSCVGHVTYPEIISLPLTTEITLRELLEFVSQEELSGENATLDYRGDRTFVVSVKCKSCNGVIDLNKPSFRIFEVESICSSCSKDTVYDDEQISTKKTVAEFNLSQTSDTLLCMSLWQLGIPHRHIIAVYDSNQNYKYYELSHDNPFTQI
jgi:molybdopterin-synthase adenylyltransferase